MDKQSVAVSTTGVCDKQTIASVPLATGRWLRHHNTPETFQMQHPGGGTKQGLSGLRGGAAQRSEHGRPAAHGGGGCFSESCTQRASSCSRSKRLLLACASGYAVLMVASISR
jgi:hypothetical protein